MICVDARHCSSSFYFDIRALPSLGGVVLKDEKWVKNFSLKASIMHFFKK
jgi:hypothetical protein